MTPTPRPRRPRTVFHYKVDHLLSPADAAAYADLLLQPLTTIDTAHAWLNARGYALSRSAVARHRRRFLARREAARARAAESDAVLKKVLLAAREAGPEGFAAACLGGSQLALFNFLMEIEHFDEFPIDRYVELTKAIGLNIRAQRDVMEMQRQAREPASAEAAAAKGAALAEAERKDALARKVWAILEPNRPIEQFLGEDPDPSDPEPGAERKP
jgi:hypothetical protein